MFQRHSSRRAGAVRCISARCAQPRPPPSDFLLGSQSVSQQVPLAPPSPLRTRLPTQDLAPSSTGSMGTDRLLRAVPPASPPRATTSVYGAGTWPHEDTASPTASQVQIPGPNRIYSLPFCASASEAQPVLSQSSWLPSYGFTEERHPPSLLHCAPLRKPLSTKETIIAKPF